MSARRVLLGVSGAIAAYKAADVIRGLRVRGVDVTVAMTANAHHFVTPFLLANLSGKPVIAGQYEAEAASVRHVNLAFETELLLLAPATADLLAKLAHGLADDFLTTFHLATPAPLLIAPAMNTRMWEHPATQANVLTLRERGARFIGPVEGDLATLHRGIGRLADPALIVAAALRQLDGGLGLEHEVVLVTAARTEEDIDLARTVTNRASGRMGFALAEEAAARGAETILITGPTELEAPAVAEVVRVRSGEEMRQAVAARLARASVVIMAAAVADFRPAEIAAGKLKKSELREIEVAMVRTIDILSEISAKKGERIVVGFAAEDADVEARSREKLLRKGVDLVVGNDISRSDRGFAAEENEVIIVGHDGLREEVSKRPKREVAARVLDHVERLLRERRA